MISAPWYKSLITALILLPGNALVFIPALIVWVTRETPFAAQTAGPSRVIFWVAAAAAAKGFILMAWTMRDFLAHGKGTPAPWAPPQRLVVRGPYRHVRNPMISGVILALLAESLILRSLPVGLWLAVFAAANMIYLPLREEPGLEKRFGDAYRQYKANVPRWFPRMSAWRPPDGG